MRPMVAFAFNLLSTFPTLNITFIVHGTALTTLEEEIKRLEAPGSSQARFTSYGVGNPAIGPCPPFTLIDDAEKSVEDLLRRILNLRDREIPVLFINDVSEVSDG